MKYDPSKHHRRSIRLPAYDYSQEGMYFITICTHQRECLFGEVVDGEMRLNEYGKIVAEEWLNTARVRANVELHEFVVMPNHFHAVLEIVGANRLAPVDANHRFAPVDATRRFAPVGASRLAPTDPRKPRAPAPGSLGAIMSQFKSIVTKRINTLRGTPAMPVWQRNYWEHIIRNENELKRICEYIINNPMHWDTDIQNPAKKRV